MPNIASAKKRVRITQKKTMENKAAKSELRTVLKKADTAVTAGAEDKEAAVKLAIKKVDQACAKGLLHKNTASRKKSQLARKLNANG